MARRQQRGVRKIEIFKHEVSQMEVPIYLNTNNSTFETEVEQDGWRCIDKDLNVLKSKVAEYLDNRVDLGWRWIIEIEYSSRSNLSRRSREHVFGFKKSKYLLSNYRVNGKYLKTEPRQFLESHPDYNNLEKYYLQDATTWRWGSRDDEGDIEFPYSHEGHFGNPMVCLEYSEEVWAALDKMQETISRVNAQFQELIGTNEGYNRMEQIGRDILKMLPAPSEQERSDEG